MIIVSYTGDPVSLDLSKLSGNAKRENAGSTLNLSRMCSKQLSQDEFDFIAEHYPEVHRMFGEHPQAEREEEPEPSKPNPPSEPDESSGDDSGASEDGPPPVPVDASSSTKNKRKKKQ
jgi:hypothetical protein